MTYLVARLIHTGASLDDEPYLVADEAQQVYYVPDPKHNEWCMVVHVKPRYLYDMGDESEDYYAPLNQTGPETIQSLEGIEGSNAGMFQNDTNISNPNITAADAGTVNKQEDCLRLSNQSAVKCP